ncbi:LacI family DNA-binding transcriptional regulator [Lactiplantibacillus paraxiangfangensis]|uniref:LacI family DNA-binding transcriptional regulator n=1 Tax=Lactiplantibacillus paraxiangfangensis TaxID=3076224 RepID=UPI0030C678FC
MNKKNNVSIKDVAKASGVSITTVSRIINNTGRFSKVTQKKVIQTIDDLGYEQNKLAVSLRSNKSNTVGIMLPDITNEFYSAIVKKCEQLLFSNGYSSIICNTERSSEREAAYSQVLMEHRVDGLIIISSAIDDSKVIKTTTIPTVYIDRDPHSHNELIVSSDHYNGGEIATKFILNHQLNPFLIMTKTKTSSTMERVRAFKDVLKEHQITDIESRVFSLDLTSDKFLETVPSLDNYLQKIVSLKKPAGIFGINDNVAYMIIRAAQRLNINVPKTISVIGFDGNSFSEISAPKITTIVQNTTKLAQESCRLLLQQMTTQDKDVSPAIIKVPVQLVIKESTVH